jgi:hypothetical protein
MARTADGAHRGRADDDYLKRRDQRIAGNGYLRGSIDQIGLRPGPEATFDGPVDDVGETHRGEQKVETAVRSDRLEQDLVEEVPKERSQSYGQDAREYQIQLQDHVEQVAEVRA